MRAYVTGGTGFVGSNIVKVFTERHGAVVHCPLNRFVSRVADGRDRRASQPAGHRGDTAQRAEFRARRDRAFDDPQRRSTCHATPTGELAWRSYVGTTETLARGRPHEVGAKLILVSTDWVFDGTQPGANEDTPPNPVNLYGVLKMASEMAALARGAVVARVSAVSGTHWVRTSTPRWQDGGFGYFITSLVAALGSGRRFGVWESDSINMVASPSLASECAEVMWRIARSPATTGVFHCCGSGSAGRMELARLACDVFHLDAGLLASIPPASDAEFRIPYDTSLAVRRTSEILDYQPPAVRELVERFRVECDTGALAPAA